MLLDLLEDPHEIRRICIMGRNCTLKRGNDDMECSLPLDKQIAEGKRLQKRFYPPTGEFINIDFYCAFIAEEEEEIEMLLENYLQRS